MSPKSPSSSSSPSSAPFFSHQNDPRGPPPPLSEVDANAVDDDETQQKPPPPRFRDVFVDEDDHDRDAVGDRKGAAASASASASAVASASSSSSSASATTPSLVGPPRVVVIAVDAQDHSKTAFLWSFAHLVRPGVDRVFVVNVVFKPNVYEPYDVSPERAHQHRLLASFRGMVDPSFSRIETVGLAGQVGERIAAVAAAEKADFVVVGRRRKGEKKGLGAIEVLRGSVSRYLGKHCGTARLLRVESLEDVFDLGVGVGA